MVAQPTTRLFTPITVGATKLAHRVVMAPLTRFRASDTHAPTPMVKEYYGQRACVPGTLLISEATLVSKRGGGYNNVPGIYTQEHIDAWKKVVDEVHSNGSKMFLQLWFLGRVAHADVAKAEGITISSSSAVKLEGTPGLETPHAMTEEEIWTVIGDYAQAAKNAVEGAGFDGVEIHGANGYLIDQFTKDTVNQRTDKWGGSIQNRSRFAVEVAKAVVAAVGADRTGIRLSPYNPFQGMDMADPMPQFTDLISQLSELNLAYLHLVWRNRQDASSKPAYPIDFALDAWGRQNPVLVCGWMNPENSRDAIDRQFHDANVAIVFGRDFISNPDLVFRLEHGVPLKAGNSEDYYRPKTAQGYTDYAFSEQWLQHQQQATRL